MKIIIEMIEHNKQRYDTCGDWTFDSLNQTLSIKVSAVSYPLDVLIAVHELVEALIVLRQEGWAVAQSVVDAWDMNYSGPYEEPGDDPDAPYHAAHRFATGIEVLLAKELGVNWLRYNKEVSGLKWSPPAPQEQVGSITSIEALTKNMKPWYWREGITTYCSLCGAEKTAVEDNLAKHDMSKH